MLFLMHCLVVNYNDEHKKKEDLMIFDSIEYPIKDYYHLENKLKYGEVHTPEEVVKDLIQMLPPEVIMNKDFTWVDVGAGKGNISVVLSRILFDKLHKSFPDIQSCRDHILSKITLIEINPIHTTFLTSVLQFKHVICQDFLLHTGNDDPQTYYDVVISNPPFNSNGMIKVPLNKKNECREGITVWREFIKRSLHILKDNGYLCVIIPSIWMKPDREGMYKLLTQYKIIKIKSFSNTEFNRMFKGQAQTPCSFVILQKTLCNITITNHTIEIFDHTLKSYCPFDLPPSMPIPVFAVSLINKIYPYTKKVGSIQVEKTNVPGRNIILSDDDPHQQEELQGFPYKNIHTCLISNGNCPIIEYINSNEPCAYHGESKIVMAHGMYGFPFIDKDGKYGVSNRDKYVILHKTYDDMVKLSSFLSTKTALYLFEATKYRMKYLERYIFSYLPDISKLTDFPLLINDDTIADYFGFSKEEKEAIHKKIKKTYVAC